MNICFTELVSTGKNTNKSFTSKNTSRNETHCSSEVKALAQQKWEGNVTVSVP